MSLVGTVGLVPARFIHFGTFTDGCQILAAVQGSGCSCTAGILPLCLRGQCIYIPLRQTAGRFFIGRQPGAEIGRVAPADRIHRQGIMFIFVAGGIRSHHGFILGLSHLILAHPKAACQHHLMLALIRTFAQLTRRAAHIKSASRTPVHIQTDTAGQRHRDIHAVPGSYRESHTLPLRHRLTFWLICDPGTKINSPRVN